MHFQKILQQLLPVLGQNALWMELHPVNGKLFVPEPHDLGLVVSGNSSDLQHGRKRLTFHQERMIPRGLEILRQSRED